MSPKVRPTPISLREYRAVTFDKGSTGSGRGRVDAPVSEGSLE